MVLLPSVLDTSKLHRYYKFLRGPGLSLRSKIKLSRSRRYQPLDVKLWGKQLKSPDAISFRGVYYELFIQEHYRFKSASAQPLIIDCGANVGLSVLYFKRLYPSARIIAYEADPGIYAYLQHNVEASGLTDVALHQKAVWKEEGTISFVEEGGASGMITEGEQAGSQAITIPAMRLKTELQQHDHIDFLKVDVEGAEYEILVDCAEELHRVQYAFIEYHSMVDQEQCLGKLLDILSAAGFRYHITDVAPSAFPFVKRRTVMNMDLLLNIYAYRVS